MIPQCIFQGFPHYALRHPCKQACGQILVEMLSSIKNPRDFTVNTCLTCLNWCLSMVLTRQILFLPITTPQNERILVNLLGEVQIHEQSIWSSTPNCHLTLETFLAPHLRIPPCPTLLPHRHTHNFPQISSLFPTFTSTCFLIAYPYSPCLHSQPLPSGLHGGVNTLSHPLKQFSGH